MHLAAVEDGHIRGVHAQVGLEAAEPTVRGVGEAATETQVKRVVALDPVLGRPSEVVDFRNPGVADSRVPAAMAPVEVGAGAEARVNRRTGEAARV